MSPCGDRGVAGGNTYHYATANLVTAEPPGPLVGCLVAASPRRAENAAILERARSSGALCARWRSSAMQFQRRCARQRARTPLQPRARARRATMHIAYMRAAPPRISRRVHALAVTPFSP